MNITYTQVPATPRINNYEHFRPKNFEHLFSLEWLRHWKTQVESTILLAQPDFYQIRI